MILSKSAHSEASIWNSSVISECSQQFQAENAEPGPLRSDRQFLWSCSSGALHRAVCRRLQELTGEHYLISEPHTHPISMCVSKISKES